MANGGSSAKWVVLVLLLLGAAGGGFYAGRPDLFAQLLGGFSGSAIPELAASHVKIGYIDLRKDSYRGIDSAIDNFQKAITLADRYADAEAAMAEALLARAEWMEEEAAALNRAAKETAKKDAASQAERARQLHSGAVQRKEEAFAHGRRALTLDPDGVAANRAMADYYRLTGAEDQMRSLIARAQASAPNDPGVAYVLGSIAASEPAASERAARYLDTALEREPRMQRSRFKLARIYHQRGEAAKAKLHLEMILDAVPDHERAKALLARVGKSPPPPKVEKKPPPKKPDKPETDSAERTFNKLYQRAERLRRADESLRALAVYQQALELQPGDLDALVGLGWSQIDLDQPSSARATFSRVLARSPRFSEAHMGMAEAYKMHGMKRDAVKHYRIYLDIAPYGTEADVARRILKELQ